MLNNLIVMKFVDADANEFSFAPNFPLYEKTHENVRLDPQGTAVIRKYNIRLEGFLLGDDNREIIAKYKALAAILNRGEVKFTYTTTTTGGAEPPVEIVHNNQLMYVEGFSEPMDWKQYDGSYSINLYYNKPLEASEFIPIAASYNGYSFQHTPTWDRSTEPNSQDYNDFLVPIGKSSNGTLVSINMKGMLTSDIAAADQAVNLEAKVQELEDALEANNRYGLLNYGSFAANVRVMGYSIQETIPYQQAAFSVSMKYQISNIFDLKASRSVSRVHWHPRIKEKPFCGRRSITLLNRSGQTITWNLSCIADTIELARTQLETEAAARVIPGGVEIEGGDEKQDENTRTVALTITRFYSTPIIPNISGEGALTIGVA